MSTVPYPPPSRTNGATPEPLPPTLEEAHAQIAHLRRALYEKDQALLAMTGKAVRQEAEIARRTTIWRETLQWLANPAWDPAAKVVAFNVWIHQGGAPGLLPQNPLSDTTDVSIAEMGRRSGLGAKQTSVVMETLALNGLIRYHQEKKRVAPSGPRPAGAPPPPPVITQTKLDPLAGKDAPILNLAKVTPVAKSPRAEKHRKKEAEKREETAKKLDRLKVLEARCLDCGESNPDKLAVRCHKCGCTHMVADYPDAKRVVRGTRERPFKRREQAHPIDADGHPIPKVGAEQCSAPQLQQQELFGAPDPAPAPKVEITTGAELRAGQAAEKCSAKVNVLPTSPPTGGMAEKCSGPGAREAAELLYAIFGRFEEHITLLQGKPSRDGRKYSTEDKPLSVDLLEKHLLGTVTLGGRLALADFAAPSGARTRAWAWDTDEKDGRLA
jgi:hypothetical protein